MSAFRDIMSIVDPTATKTSTAPRQAQPASGPKPIPHPAGTVNGAPQLKRRASSAVKSSQVKLQRKDGPGQTASAEGAGRSMPTSGTTRPSPLAAVSSVPYRGTAAPVSAKNATPTARKPIPQVGTSHVGPKAAAPPPKPATPMTTSSMSVSAAPKKGYLALLQKAKEKDSIKPAAPPVQNGQTKMLTKKERLALKAEANAAAKGKKVGAGSAARPSDAKVPSGADRKKPVEVAYQGTARPAKQPTQVGYKGTARPASAPASTGRSGTSSAVSKSKPAKGRYDGYADWSDLDDMEDEDDYESDASSDMEGGLWDVEEEEQLALKAAKQEDAEALAEETRLKREKEERKRKLMAISQQAAAKRKKY